MGGQGKKGNAKAAAKDWERHAVMIVYRKELEKSMLFYKQVRSIIACVAFKTRCPPLIIHRFYAPHEGIKPSERQQLYAELRDHHKKVGKTIVISF